MRYYLLNFLGIVLTLLTLCNPLVASDVNSQINSDQNISVQREKSSANTTNNINASDNIPQKLKSFFGGILDDIREFAEDNHINEGEK